MVTRVLALEPYYGGSHAAFLDGWMAHSRHQIELVTLPAHHWKWRMRHAAASLAPRLLELQRGAGPKRWDVLWLGSMGNLAELLGILTRHEPELASLPAVLYFHENQLAYPSRHEEPRDVHFAFTHWLSCLAATEIWFNSAFNRDTLLEGLSKLFRKVPDQKDSFQPQALLDVAHVLPPGIALPAVTASSPPRALGGPLHVVWAARWEHDKGPELLFDALTRLRERGCPFRLSLLGQSYNEVPAVFERFRQAFASELCAFGYQTDRSAYARCLAEADVFVSTAQHEFFGIAVLEAASQGCQLLLPRRLVYPELFPKADVFYDGTADGLAQGLLALAQCPRSEWRDARPLAEGYDWKTRAAALDEAIDRVVQPRPKNRSARRDPA